ncbi:hypothetical protein, partial [Sphingomonas trueperi]
FQHHPHRARANLRRELVRRLARHRPFLSGVGASDKPGAVHLNVLETAWVPLVRKSRVDRESGHGKYQNGSAGEVYLRTHHGFEHAEMAHCQRVSLQEVSGGSLVFLCAEKGRDGGVRQHIDHAIV